MSNITQEIISLYRAHGNQTYGEDCTVLEHSVQSGLLAREQGLDDELILAAFLHDIGHLLPLATGQTHDAMGQYGVQSHEDIGADWLNAKGFTPRVTAPIQYHVAAKRYLCSIDTAYWDHLSTPSRETLLMQGGSMTEEEVITFEALPLHEESILIRQIDDEAKAEDFTVQSEHWEYFEALLNKVEQEFMT